MVTPASIVCRARIAAWITVVANDSRTIAAPGSASPPKQRWTWQLMSPGSSVRPSRRSIWPDGRLPLGHHGVDAAVLHHDGTSGHRRRTGAVYQRRAAQDQGLRHLGSRAALCATARLGERYTGSYAHELLKQRSHVVPGAPLARPRAARAAGKREVLASAFTAGGRPRPGRRAGRGRTGRWSASPDWSRHAADLLATVGHHGRGTPVRRPRGSPQRALEGRGAAEPAGVEVLGPQRAHLGTPLGQCASKTV